VEHALLVADRLRSRRPELEAALLARVYGIGDPGEIEDPAYVDGLRGAAAAAVDFAVELLEGPTNDQRPVPPVLLLQARLAARNRVRMDVVLRRYAGGHAILVDAIIEDAEREGDFSPAELRRLLTTISSAFDRLLIEVGDEYARESVRNSRNAHERSQIDRVERLLAGELVASDQLDYPLDAWHIGLVVEGSGLRPILRDFALQIDRRLLAVEPRTGTMWAWLGGRARVDSAEVIERLRHWSIDVKIGMGEAGCGVAGWRLSHQQALAVLPLAQGHPVAVARYAEKGILASMQKDRVLVDSLRHLYVEPLSDEKDDEAVLAETLRAYFSAECSASSAASALHVHRQTVTSRLRTIEERLGRSISDCSLELNLALALTFERR
jgi:PucR-like helix-turn-helix protein/diguanylate cyclase with GGDEF domain